MQEQLAKTLQMIIDGTPEYKFGKVEINAAPIRGTKVGYATKYRKGKTVSGKIMIDSRFVEWCNEGNHDAELLDVIRHELAHLIAETLNTKKKHVWHGQAWKDILLAIGGDGQRYYSGSFVKPENVGKEFTPIKDLYNRLPTQPATDWERGTFRQWLERGYHVIKGQKGQVQVWEFKGNAYETAEDGKESQWGRAAAVYFTPDQVEPNTPREAK